MFNKNDILNKFHKLKTPFYYYDIDILNRNLQSLLKYSDRENNKIHYAIKANSNNYLLKIIKEYGIGIDAVSSNEIKEAINTGFESKNIVFAGVGKSDDEITYAIKKDISYFNCESLQELEVINQLAKNLLKKISISIRINPNIKTETHKKIQTGFRDNKFGIDINDVNYIPSIIKKLKNIHLVGIHFHLGSQIASNEPFIKLCKVANDINEFLSDNSINIKFINVGGGLSVNYNEPLNDTFPNFKDFFTLYNSNIKLKNKQEIHFELGRSIICQCGSLISRILYTKQSFGRKYIILDSGMNNLIRPALYNSKHMILNLSSDSSDKESYDVVGPICESSDVFRENCFLPKSSRNDIIAICSTGAYGDSMSSNYNLRGKIKSYYSDSI